MSQQDAQKTCQKTCQITLFYKKVMEDSEDVLRVASATETLCRTGHWRRDAHTGESTLKLFSALMFICGYLRAACIFRQCRWPHAKLYEMYELRLLQQDGGFFWLVLLGEQCSTSVLPAFKLFTDVLLLLRILVCLSSRIIKSTKSFSVFTVLRQSHVPLKSWLQLRKTFLLSTLWQWSFTANPRGI